MEKYLDQRDTDYVRDNLIFNYCLGDDQQLLIESYVHNNQLDIRFQPERFYFLMTGTHKKFTKPFTPQTFHQGVDNIYRMYEIIRQCLQDNGWDGNVFLIKEDNSKQAGVLFSAKETDVFSASEMAKKLYQTYQNMHAGHNYISTSFVGPYSGYDQIHQAFLDARELNDLIFFGVRDVVITKEYRKATAHPCDVNAIHANARRLINAVCSGTCQQAVRQAEYIIRELIAPSYSMSNFTALFTHCDDLMSMLETVYPQRVHLTHRPQASFFTLEDYRVYLIDAIRAAFAQLAGVPRYSPTLLMALSYINRNYTRDLSLTQLSEYVYANASTLSSDFNTEVGMSLSEYVTGLRIERAQALLMASELSVPDIAAKTGFASAKYFREIFKKQTGLSPQAYRSRIYKSE